MLTWIRKRSGSRWVKILMVVLALTFFGGFGLVSSTKVRSCMGMEQHNREGLVYARIDGMNITQTEFSNAFNRQLNRRRAMLQQQNQGMPISEDMIDREQLRPEVMDSLVAQKIINREAKELGIEISDEEVREEIAKTPNFSDQQGNFSPALYRSILSRQGLNPQEFEEMVREGLRRRRVQQALTSAVRVFPEEVEEHYAFDMQMIKLDYLVIDPAVVADQVKPPPERVKQYFEDHPLEFYLGDTRQVDYVSWSAEGVISGITVSASEIEQYYEDVKERYMTSPEQVNASHILVKVSPDAPVSEVEAARKLINEVHGKLEAGADFAKMASQYSEDATAQEGGELGWFARQEDAGDYQLPAMVEDFEKAAFALEPGRISDPVRTDFGFHIIKVTDRKPAEYKPFSEVRSDLVFDVKHGKAMMKIQRRAEELKNSVEEGKTLKESAEQAGKEVRTSNWFQLTDDKVFGMEDSEVIVEKAFDLDKGEVSEPIQGQDHVYIIKLIKITPEHEASLEEVRPRIVKKLTPQARLEHTREYANTLLEKLREGETTIKDAAEEDGIKFNSTDFQERGMFSLPDMEDSEELMDQLLEVTEDNIWPEKPVKVEDKIIIIKLADTKPPDMSGFPQYKATYRQEILRRKQMEVMENWIDNMEEKLVTYTDNWKEFIGEKDKEQPGEEAESS